MTFNKVAAYWIAIGQLVVYT